MNTLAAQALDADHANFRLGNETFETAGALFVRNTERPLIYDANHVASITASTANEVDALLSAAEREYQHTSHRRFRTDFRTPPEFAARLVLNGGYERQDSLFLVLEGELVGTPPVFDIRPIETEEQWEALRGLTLADWSEHRERLNQPADERVGQQLFQAKRSKQPPVQIFLAYVDNVPVGNFHSWPGDKGVGQVEDLFVLPAFRKRGIATALIHHCVWDARTKGAGPVIIVADPADTPRLMYARMGFRPVAVASSYHKKLD